MQVSKSLIQHNKAINTPIRTILVVFVLAGSNLTFCFCKVYQATTYEVVDITIMAGRSDYHWYEFPVEAVFEHKQSGTVIRQFGFWNGGREWVIRFSPILDGEWTYRTVSNDAGLDNQSGTVSAMKPTEELIKANPNYHGRIQVSGNGRYFEYSDGTPFFLLGDTEWAINTRRCGLGENRDGPFYQYLADRKSKGFTTIMMKFIRGTGDTRDPNCQANEGGYPFNTLESKHLNPEFFKYLDIRMHEVWNTGLVGAMPAAWFGKRRCFMDLEWAKRLVAYEMVRYGAFNGFFAISGEYLYTFLSCGWTGEDLDELGQHVEKFNPYQKLVSVHPSGRTKKVGEVPMEMMVQSSRPFHHSSWLSNNWLQTGQSFDQMFNIVGRSLENYALEPVKPVFLSEGYYETHIDSAHVYHSRWQPWSAFLNGSAGYSYGAFGLWNFYEPTDSVFIRKKSQGVTYIQNILNRSGIWYEVLNYGGGNQMQHVRRFLSGYEWWKMKPSREKLKVNGNENPLPTAADISPPQCATIESGIFIMYFPRGNEDNRIELTGIINGKYEAHWFNPRSGVSLGHHDLSVENAEAVIPERPEPASEDWVYVIEK